MVFSSLYFVAVFLPLFLIIYTVLPARVAWKNTFILLASILFYAWGDEECCLPRGATTATLKDEWVPGEQPEPQQPPPYQQTTQQQSKEHCPPPISEPPKPKRKLHLEKGDILIFEEVVGPKTGDPADARRS